MFQHFDRASRASATGLTPGDIAAISGQYGVHML
jgi:hypothetical protein